MFVFLALVGKVSWEACSADLRASLYRYNVPDREQNEVIDLVNSVKGDIVTASN